MARKPSCHVCNHAEMVGIVLAAGMIAEVCLQSMSLVERFSNAAQGPQGLDNLLYSADADFSCFADLALTSPVEYYREGQGSLLQCVLTPADPYMPMPNEEIAAKVHQQVRELCS